MYDYPIDKAVVLEAIKQIDQGIDEGVSYGLPEFLNSRSRSTILPPRFTLRTSG